jgi:hypothetical protein
MLATLLLLMENSAKIGKSSSFLAASFYLDNEGKQNDYEQRYSCYKKKENNEIVGCNWF